MWITTPQHDSSLVPTSAAFHLRFLFSVYFLFIIAHPASAVFVQPPPPLSFFLFPSAIADLICHFPPMARSIRQASSLCVPFFFSRLSFSLHLFSSPPQMNSRARPPPNPPPPTPTPSLWTLGCETWLGFIYIFLALSWSLLLLILLLWNDFNKRESGGVLQWHRTVLGSSDTVKEKSLPPPPVSPHLSRHPTTTASLRRSSDAPCKTSSLFICCPHSPPSQITMYFI